MNKTQEALKLALEALEYDGLLKRKQAITAIREALAEQPAQQQTDERIDALRTLDYCHGLKAGWNFCAADDDAGFERAMAGTSEAVRILKTQPAQQQEPHGWYIDGYGAVLGTSEPKSVRPGEWLPFYTSPPASKPWVGLEPRDFTGVIKGDAFECGAYWANNILREKNA